MVRGHVLLNSRIRLVERTRPDGRLQLDVFPETWTKNLFEFFSEIIIEPAVKERIGARWTHAPHMADGERYSEREINSRRLTLFQLPYSYLSNELSFPYD